MEPTAKPKPRKTALLATNDQQLAAQATAAAQYWPGQAWLTLRYTTAAKFTRLAADYAAAVDSRQQAGSPSLWLTTRRGSPARSASSIASASRPTS